VISKLWACNYSALTRLDTASPSASAAGVQAADATS